MMPFGETVLVWRLARGMTQDALARAARMSRPNLSAIERGDRDVTLRTLRALALALGVRPGVLVDGQGPDDSGSAGLGRDDLERVAAAAGEPGTRPAAAHRRAASQLSARERDLAGHLAAVTGRRRGGGRRAGRQGDRAYLLLRAREAPETIASLVDRIRPAPPPRPRSVARGRGAAE